LFWLCKCFPEGFILHSIALHSLLSQILKVSSFAESSLTYHGSSIFFLQGSGWYKLSLLVNSATILSCRGVLNVIWVCFFICQFCFLMLKQN
jgi:hypothetical protein